MSFGVVVGRKRRKGILRDNLYSLGSAAGDWVEGSSSGMGSVSKESDHLHAEVPGSAISTEHRTWVTSSTQDLTDFSSVKIEWEALGDNTANNNPRLIASTDQNGSPTVVDKLLSKSGTFSRTTDTMDVSALTGSYYIRFHARDQGGTSANQSIVNAYRIWLEE